jgi:hypothetical protein
MTYAKFTGTNFRPDPKPESRPKPKKGQIPRISAKRMEANKEYKTLREVFLNGKICPVTGGKATQVHHKKGRTGSLFLDVRFWLGVSAEGHRKIEENPEWAKEMGYSLNRL